MHGAQLGTFVLPSPAGPKFKLMPTDQILYGKFFYLADLKGNHVVRVNNTYLSANEITNYGVELEETRLIVLI
jgi:hypothetical protein